MRLWKCFDFLSVVCLKTFSRQILMSSGLSIKGGNALGILCSNELLILNTKFFMDVSYTYWFISEMENGSNVAQCYSCNIFLLFQNRTI